MNAGCANYTISEIYFHLSCWATILVGASIGMGIVFGETLKDKLVMFLFGTIGFLIFTIIFFSWVLC